MSTTLEPRGDRLLVEPIEEERITASGIILPDQAREKPQRGRIIALGPECNMREGKLRRIGELGEGTPIQPDPLELGDEVLYSKYGGTELKVDGEEVILLRETDVFCRVQEDEGAEPDIRAKAHAGQA